MVGDFSQPVRVRLAHAGGRRTSSFVCLVVLLMMGIALTSCAGTAAVHVPNLASPIVNPPTIAGSPAVQGPLRSPGGPFLYDQRGRVVFLHGVNAVYKLPPFELYPAAGKPWNFTAADASLMARLGFNVVRLGMTWKGLEPGTAPSNDPAICTPGRPHDPGQFNQAVLDSYLSNLAQTVRLLGQFHIYTLLDMHQDVYNELFDGEGAPNWAVCTDGIPNTEAPGRWSQNYGTAAAGAAYRHFWTNNVVGDLQGEYDRVWAAVAGYFHGNPWVVGYDPFNEPFSTSLVSSGDEQFDGQLECFYTGTTLVGSPGHGAPAIRCPKDDPGRGVVPQVLAADPAHLIFYEPDIFGRRGLHQFRRRHGFPEPGVQRPRLLHPTQWEDRQPDEHRGLRCARGPLLADPGRGPDRPLISGTATGPGVVRERVRRYLEPGAARPAHQRGGSVSSGLDLLVVEVLWRPHRECRRGVGHRQWAAPAHRRRVGSDVPRGDRRTTDLSLIRSDEWNLPPRLRSRSCVACSNRDLRPDTGSLPQRLLRSGIGGFGDIPTRQ